MIFLMFFYLYLASGLVVGFSIVFFLAQRVDPSLDRAPIALRLLLLPATSVLWPWILALYMNKTKLKPNTQS
jgi:hypothetical protein